MARLLDGANSSIVTTIWEDLKAKYKELEEVGKWLATDPRVTVIGEPAARPKELFEALFGAATGAVEPDEGEGVWQVYASFEVEEPPGGGTIGGAGDDELALCYLRETDVVLLCVRDDRAPTETELALYDHVTRLRRIYSVVVTTPTDAEPAETDRDREHTWVARELAMRRAFANQQLPCHRNDRLRAKDLVTLVRSVHDRLDAKLRLKLISRLRHEASRDALVCDMIHSMSRTAAFLGVNPIPYADAIAILPVQVLLVCRIAAAYGQKITVQDRQAFGRVTALVGFSGIGFREVYRAIKRRLNDPQLPLQMGLGAAVAWAGTELIGHAARLHFGSHGAIAVEQARQEAAKIVAETSLLGSCLV